MAKQPREITVEVNGVSVQQPVKPMSTFKKDLGIRAVLALISLIAYEAMVAAVLVFLWILKALSVESGLAVLGLSQTPALLAMNAYFNKKDVAPSANNPPAAQ